MGPKTKAIMQDSVGHFVRRCARHPIAERIVGICPIAEELNDSDWEWAKGLAKRYEVQL